MIFLFSVDHHPSRPGPILRQSSHEPRPLRQVHGRTGERTRKVLNVLEDKIYFSLWSENVQIFHLLMAVCVFEFWNLDYIFLDFELSNGHSRQIRETRALLVRICRGESHFSRKWLLASVGESGESAQHGSASVGESGESAQHGSANVGESGESAQHGLANVGESGKSCIFPKTAILASTRTRQKRRVSREYSNSLNSLASSHCLFWMQF